MLSVIYLIFAFFLIEHFIVTLEAMGKFII